MIDSSTFTNNFALENGGALYLSRIDSLSISGLSTFKNNLAKLSGSDLYVMQSDGNLTLRGTDIDNGQGMNSVHMESVRFMATGVKIRSKKFFFFYV